MTYSFFVELVCKQYSNCLMEMLYYANEINNHYLKKYVHILLNYFCLRHHATGILYFSNFISVLNLNTSSLL